MDDNGTSGSIAYHEAPMSSKGKHNMDNAGSPPQEDVWQRERLRALGHVAAGAAHDVRNALTVVLGRIDLIRQKLGRDEPITDDLAVMQTASQSAIDILQRIQGLGSHTGSPQYTWHDVDLPALLEEAAAFVRTKIPNFATLQMSFGTVPKVRGSTGELREVLINLLSNAFESLEATAGRGSVMLRCYTDDQGCAVVMVEDNGPGIPDALQHRIFEPFFSTKPSGMGIGLSVSQSILRRHDAVLRVEPIRNVPAHDEIAQTGTRFCITFPSPAPWCAPASIHTEQMITPKETQRASRKAVVTDAQNLRILVVDDDAAIREMLHDLLSADGHIITTVVNIHDALSTLKRTEPDPWDLILTDLDLPDGSGWELARQARESCYSLRVGLLTGWPLGATQEELLQRGVHFALEKPFDPGALAHALQQCPSSPRA